MFPPLVCERSIKGILHRWLNYVGPERSGQGVNPRIEVDDGQTAAGGTGAALAERAASSAAERAERSWVLSAERHFPGHLLQLASETDAIRTGATERIDSRRRVSESNRSANTVHSLEDQGGDEFRQRDRSRPSPRPSRTDSGGV